MTAHLYRGVHETKFRGVASALTPKESAPFLKPPKWDVTPWDSDWNPSVNNAINEHQHMQLGLPTSGVSTTPHFHRAKLYALGKDQSGCGYVVVLDRNRFEQLGIKEFVVADVVRHPAIPEDEEVILVTGTFGSVPEGVVVEVVKVCAQQTIPADRPKTGSG